VHTKPSRNIQPLRLRADHARQSKTPRSSPRLVGKFEEARSKGIHGSRAEVPRPHGSRDRSDMPRPPSRRKRSRRARMANSSSGIRPSPAPAGLPASGRGSTITHSIYAFRVSRVCRLRGTPMARRPHLATRILFCESAPRLESPFGRAFRQRCQASLALLLALWTKSRRRMHHGPIPRERFRRMSYFSTFHISTLRPTPIFP
jgi:hypothetical protein